MGLGSEVDEGLIKGWNSGRHCDSCRPSATASVFCRAHSAFLCLTCDDRLHSHLFGATRHERVLVCEVCEQAPAAFTCKADAASLCLACDADIHSANPLARRHERVPVETFYGYASEAIAKSTPSSCFKFHGLEDLGIDINPGSNTKPNNNFGGFQIDGVKSEEQLLFIPDISEPVSLLDFQFPNLGTAANNDSLVPVQVEVAGGGGSIIDFSRSNLSPPFDYVQPHSINHSVSSSSVGVVPDGGSSMSDTSFPYFHNTTTPSSGPDVASTGPMTLSPPLANSGSSQSGGSHSYGAADREARVLRYREKRKNRKFQKTIRYASRKAYAESRPRIKGRFAKRTEQDHWVCGSPPRSSVPFAGANAQYGVVPTF